MKINHPLVFSDTDNNDLVQELNRMLSSYREKDHSIDHRLTGSDFFESADNQKSSFYVTNPGLDRQENLCRASKRRFCQ